MGRDDSTQLQQDGLRELAHAEPFRSRAVRFFGSWCVKFFFRTLFWSAEFRVPAPLGGDDGVGGFCGYLPSIRLAFASENEKIGGVGTKIQIE